MSRKLPVNSYSLLPSFANANEIPKRYQPQTQATYPIVRKFYVGARVLRGHSIAPKTISANAASASP